MCLVFTVPVHNQATISEDGSEIVGDGDLELSNVTISDQGLYTCRLVYPQGNTTSSPAKLFVRGTYGDRILCYTKLSVIADWVL